MYFEAFGIHNEFTLEMVKVALAKYPDVDSVLDSSLTYLKDVIVQSMCTQSSLLINLGMLGPDFNSVYTH